MDLNLNIARIAALSLSDENELVQRVGSENGERIVRLAKKPSKRQRKKQEGQKRLKSIQKKQKRDYQSLSPQEKAKRNAPPGTPEFGKFGKKPGVPAAGPKKKAPPKPGSKRALREEAMAKIPQEREKGVKYCIEQTSKKNGAPMLWVSPVEGRRRAFCRSMGPRELRRYRKKMKGHLGKEPPKSLRQLLRELKAVRPKIEEGETMGDLMLRRRMRRQLGNILKHGGMSKERLAQVAQGKPQAIKAFKKMMSGRGMGQFGMQDMTNPKAMAGHFDKFMKDWDDSGANDNPEFAKDLMKDWRKDNTNRNKEFRASKGKRGDGFAKLRMENSKRRGEAKKRRQQRDEDQAALDQADMNEDPYAAPQADPEDIKRYLEGKREPVGTWKEEADWENVSGEPTEEDLAGPREGGGAAADEAEDAAVRRRLGLPPRKAASEPLLRAATQKFLKRRRVTAAPTITESYDEFNPMIAEGNWKAAQLYAMRRADCHANLDRIAAKAFLLTDG